MCQMYLMQFMVYLCHNGIATSCHNGIYTSVTTGLASLSQRHCYLCHNSIATSVTTASSYGIGTLILASHSFPFHYDASVPGLLLKYHILVLICVNIWYQA